jgi:ATP/maltotriose-dependent transcriptional regulator MalT/DNA-binding SARP family transcriptional activator
VVHRLLEAREYRLTIVQAGAGYGKSTALAALAESGQPLVWYRLGAEDADPLVFLLHLIYGFRATLPALSEAPLVALEEWERDRGGARWATVVDLLVNELSERLQTPLLLVLDDLHLLGDTSEPIRILDRLIGRAPPDLHVILSTRQPLSLPSLVTWRVRGEVLEIGERELAFTPDEIAALFQTHYGLSFTPQEIETLATRTEGWAIALQLVWQGLRSGAVSTLSQALERLSSPSQDLFAYLAQEVLDQQPPDVQEFLLVTAVLREMTASICDRLRNARDSEQMLRYLLESGLFVVDLGGGHVRYHHLFREFLRHRLAPHVAREAHRNAATCWAEQGEEEEALYHLLAAEAFEEAAEVLDRLGRKMVRAGRLDTLSGWLGALPPEVLANHPSLLTYLGDIARLHSRFDEALGWYRQAEERSRARGDLRGVGQALRGQARVYLDTVNPSKAEHLLQEALRLADGQEDRETRARLLELLAENRLNLGRPEEAERLRAQARELREEGPGEAELAVRVLLRTGRLEQARRLLEERAEAERHEPVLRPRAHRETLLLLSLILSLQGEGERAYQCAVEGTQRGRLLHSPFVTAVGFMRQGHAWLLREEAQAYEEACRCYREAIGLGDRLAVPRLKVEAFWGLCRAQGFQGEIQAAREAAERGIEIAQQAGDEWIAALIRLSMGAGYVLAQRHEDAAGWLDRAWTAFRECSDTFGEAVARLWQCFLWWERGDTARLERGLEDLLRLVREHGYEYLFERKTLLGPPDPRRLVPLLIFARDAGIERATARNLLARLGLERIQIHPGYQLRVQTLGPFRVWRGTEEIAPHQWRREKARQLFQILLTHRQSLLDREWIVEALWPGVDPEVGRRDFKVAFSTLCRALEPRRNPRSPSAFLVRDGSRYGLRPGADLWLDAEAFERLVAEGDRLQGHDPEAMIDRYRRALVLYQGDYLEECLYEEWCSEERERLLTLYLRTADRLARTLAEREEWEEVIGVCRAILARDDCWEQAYRLMMIAYTRMGNRAQALRTYQRCVERLREGLQIEPTAETTRLYESIRDQG